MTTKITDANIDSDKQDNNAFNISLLGFKMAVNDGLTVFNLVDGVVDEFNDESGTDESEGSNDTYVAACDYYHNIQVVPGCFSAGFTTTSVTEPDTSTAGTNPTYGTGTAGSFTVPCGATSMNFYIWGAGGARGNSTNHNGFGAGGGFTSGTIPVTTSQVIKVGVGEGGRGGSGNPSIRSLGGGGGFGGSTTSDHFAGGGGLSTIFEPTFGSFYEAPGDSPSVPEAPKTYAVAAGGGGTGYQAPSFPGGTYKAGGVGGGLTGDAGGGTCNQGGLEQTTRIDAGTSGGGGDQEQGGQLADGGANGNSQAGDFFLGGNGNPDTNVGGGGSGFYGGGGGAANGSISGQSSDIRMGGGGSSYYGHPLVSCGATEEGGTPGAPACGAGVAASGGYASPLYSPIAPSSGGTPNTVGQGGGGTAGRCAVPPGSANLSGGDGYVLLTGSYCTPSPGGSTTLVSTAFTATSVPTTSRIVVFEENVDTPTLNTDIIASISRDGGTTYTNATLSDSGYVTGSSGQRILTGQATISGQPSGQSMRWKLALANNTVRIHGVSLQWS